MARKVTPKEPEPNSLVQSMALDFCLSLGSRDTFFQKADFLNTKTQRKRPCQNAGGDLLFFSSDFFGLFKDSSVFLKGRSWDFIVFFLLVFLSVILVFSSVRISFISL